MILEDEYLLNSFLVILCFVESLAGYLFTPQQKGELAAIIKTKLYKQNHILSLVDNLDDSYLMQNSSVSVQVLDAQNYLAKSQFMKNII